ncbi:MAG TPA: NUDIX domain-containing protein [Candidatus Saccharimonadales bacterium]
MGHIHEKYDFVVTVFIVHDDKVLFVNHPRYGLWVPIGGHVEMDEDPEQALFREIKEETGLEVEVLSDKALEPVEAENKFLFRPNYLGVYDATPDHRHISFNYFVRASNPDAVMSDEHTDMKWLGIDDLQNPDFDLTPSLRFYAKEAIQAARQ